jgi:hypothetical protein
MLLTAFPGSDEGVQARRIYEAQLAQVQQQLPRAVSAHASNGLVETGCSCEVKVAHQSECATAALHVLIKLKSSVLSHKGNASAHAWWLCDDQPRDPPGGITGTYRRLLLYLTPLERRGMQAIYHGRHGRFERLRSLRVFARGSPPRRATAALLVVVTRAAHEPPRSFLRKGR